jgi:signal transduction histidine kinase
MKYYIYNNPDSSEYYRVIAKNLALKIQFDKGVALIEILEAINYENSGDFKSAYIALKEYHIIKDSLLSDERKKDVELLQADYEISQSKAEVKELEYQYKQNQFRNIIYILVIVASIIIIIIIAYGSNYRKKLNSQLIQSLHVRDKLLSILAHDLKSPINNVISIVDLFETDTLSENEKKE